MLSNYHLFFIHYLYFLLYIKWKRCLAAYKLLSFQLATKTVSVSIKKILFSPKTNFLKDQSCQLLIKSHIINWWLLYNFALTTLILNQIGPFAIHTV